MKAMLYHATPLYGHSERGIKWDDGTFSGIRRIVMTTTADTLTSLKVTYALAGNDPSVLGKEFGGFTHGGAGGHTVEYILDFPSEHLVKITGYVGPEHITSLTFQTNKRKLGTCGRVGGIPFQIDAGALGAIVGLFGTATGASLNSLGAYILQA